MIEKILRLDHSLFLYLNSKHTWWLDPLMLILSSYVLWAIVFILFAILVFTKRKKFRTISVVYFAMSVALSSVGANIVKLFVKRPRPIHVEEWEGVIHNIEGYSMAYSFYSSHAATTFCIAVFSSLFFKDNKYIHYLPLLWAAGVSYSRIYVAKHYPLDVFVGIVLGAFVGWMGYYLLQKFIRQKESLST